VQFRRTVEAVFRKPWTAALTAAAILFLAAKAAGPVGFFAAGGVEWLVWYIAAKMLPRTTCGPCDGNGRIYGRIFGWMFRLCGNCTGNGRLTRWSAGHFGTRRSRQEYQEQLAGQRSFPRLRERL
jgi:hypothetical protein